MSKTIVPTGSVKIWFGLLKIAIREGLPVNWELYRDWGSRDELLTTTFNHWWKKRGEVLFQNAVPIVTLVSAAPDALVIRVPTSLNSIQVKKQVSSLISRERGTKRLKARAPLSFSGNVEYKRLKQYERYLEIEFDKRNAGKTIEEKTEMLKEAYRKIKTRMDKQKTTLRAAGKGRISRKFKSRDVEEFGTKFQKGIDAKKVSRWRLSGKLLLLNVAEGQFPGKGYYGSKLSGRLKGRLAALGIEDIGATVRNAGGGRKKEQLTHVKVRRTKRESDAESLKAYGKGKDSNPVGAEG